MLINRIEGLPEVPVTHFALKLFGGDKGLLKNPKSCGGKRIESTTPVKLDTAEFQLARHLRSGVRGDKARKAATRLSAGSITFNTTGKDMTVPISAKRSKNGNVSFTPLRRGGRRVVQELAGFSANLVRTRRRQPNLTGRGTDRRTGKRVARQSDLLILSGMPKQRQRTATGSRERPGEAAL